MNGSAVHAPPFPRFVPWSNDPIAPAQMHPIPAMGLPDGLPLFFLVAGALCPLFRDITAVLSGVLLEPLSLSNPPPCLLLGDVQPCWDRWRPVA